MTKKAYPCIGETFPMDSNLSKTAPKSGSLECESVKCSNRAFMRIDIQTNMFRGDDEVFFACKGCANLSSVEILSEWSGSHE